MSSKAGDCGGRRKSNKASVSSSRETLVSVISLQPCPSASLSCCQLPTDFILHLAFLNMCKTHEERVIFSDCKVVKKPMATSYLDLLISPNAKSYGHHTVTLSHIFKCPNAPPNIKNGTCGTVTPFMAENKVKSIGVSEYRDVCPVCDADEKSRFQTIYVCYPTFIDWIRD